MTIKNADMPAMPIDRCDADAVEAGIQVFSGLTKREMMAMHIASGFAADNKITNDNIVKWSIEVADKLLSELERTCQKS